METDSDGADTAADRGTVVMTDGGTDVATSDSGTDTVTSDDAGGDAGAAAGGGPSTSTGDPGLGRRILLSVGGTVILLSGGIGWFVGSNGQLDDAAVLGTGFAIPVTPAAIALYGVVVSAAILGGLFGLVELASRLEGDTRAE